MFFSLSSIAGWQVTFLMASACESYSKKIVISFWDLKKNMVLAQETVRLNVENLRADGSVKRRPEPLGSLICLMHFILQEILHMSFLFHQRLSGVYLPPLCFWSPSWLLLEKVSSHQWSQNTIVSHFLISPALENIVLWEGVRNVTPGEDKELPGSIKPLPYVSVASPEYHVLAFPPFPPLSTLIWGTLNSLWYNSCKVDTVGISPYLFVHMHTYALTSRASVSQPPKILWSPGTQI